MMLVQCLQGADSRHGRLLHSKSDHLYRSGQPSPESGYICVSKIQLLPELVRPMINCLEA